MNRWKCLSPPRDTIYNIGISYMYIRDGCPRAITDEMPREIRDFERFYIFNVSFYTTVYGAPYCGARVCVYNNMCNVYTR